jgi:hypothetical protein
VVESDFKAVKDSPPQDVFVAHYGDADRGREKPNYLKIPLVKRDARNNASIT